MENKKQIMILLSAVFLLSFMFMASASVSIVTPATSSTINGVYVFNVSAVAEEELAVCNFTMASATTNASAGVLIGNSIANNSVINVNMSYNTAGLQDGADYIFTAYCLNLTGDPNTATATGIKIDNTVPTAPSSLTPTSDSDGDVVFSSTVIGENTTACTLYFVDLNPGFTSYTMTHSANTCSYSLNGVPDQIYDWYVQASDGLNTSSSSVHTINVARPSVGGAGIVAVQETKDDISKSKSYTWIFIILLILGLVYIIFFK